MIESREALYMYPCAIIHIFIFLVYLQVDLDKKDKAVQFARNVGLDKGQIDFSDVIPNNA